MKRFELKYGKGTTAIEFPDGVNITLVEPEKAATLPDPEAALRDALRNPIGKPALRDCVTPDMKVGIIFNDITRATPSRMMLPVILGELASVPRENITLFNALGTHRENSLQEIAAMIGEDLVNRYRIIQNNCNDRETQKYLGETSFGHEIRINRELTECDLIILTGFIEPHFFAGFSGAGKAIMPGMAGKDTIFGNHSAMMIASENATWGITPGNPIWEEIQEIAEKTGNLFLVNVTMNLDHEITGVFCGDLREAHAAGTALMRKTAMTQVDELYDAVITTNSGYPLDMNLYQAVKGMSAAARIAKPGAPIIIASECSDGIPNHGLFLEMLSSFSSPGDVYEHILNNRETVQDQWQVQILTKILLDHPIYVYSSLSDEQIHQCMMEPTHDIAKTALEFAPSGKLCVMPQGPLTIPYLKSEAE